MYNTLRGVKMKILTIITVLILAVFLAGCAAKEISVAKESEAEAKEYQKQVEEVAKQTESTRQQMEESVDETPEEHVTVETNTGDSVTFKKLEDYRRDRDLVEHCDFDYPFECSDSLAKSGVIYLTIKNQDFGSKVDDLTMYMDGEVCDPTDTFIEPGQNKEFECYVNTDKGDLVQSSFEIEYYRPIGKQHLTKTGNLVIMME